MSENSMSEPQIICVGCKTEISRSLFEKPENLKMIKEILNKAGFTVNSGFEATIKREVSSLCALCGEVKIFKLAIMTVIGVEAGEEIQERVDKLLNVLLQLAAESMWIACKRVTIGEIERARLGGRAPWRLFMRLCNLPGQPQHVGDVEKGLMQFLHDHNYSLSDLAFIFDRSKETVHRHIRKEAA